MSSVRLTNLTIVIVEDHGDARRYLGIFLDRLGANVVAARNGFEGLEAIKNCQPTVVLSDCNARTESAVIAIDVRGFEMNLA